jgi:hypothetical protein
MSMLITGWNELLIAAFSHRSVGVKDGIVLATGLVIHRLVIVSSKLDLKFLFLNMTTHASSSS